MLTIGQINGARMMMQKPKKPRIQIYMDLSYIDPQTRVLN